MGNNTTDLARALRASEAAARIGVRLEADLVELYRVEDERAELSVRWARGVGSAICTGPVVPVAWFPWSLGNIRPEEYMFIRNAGALQVDPHERRTIADLGMSSVVHLPVVSTPPVVTGAVCAYWSDELSSWDPSSRDVVCSWASDALSNRR